MKFIELEKMTITIILSCHKTGAQSLGHQINRQFFHIRRKIISSKESLNLKERQILDSMHLKTADSEN